jgi:hypothetical protein
MAGIFKNLDPTDIRTTPFRTYKLWQDNNTYYTRVIPDFFNLGNHKYCNYYDKFFYLTNEASQSYQYVLGGGDSSWPVSWGLFGNGVYGNYFATGEYDAAPKMVKFDPSNNWNIIATSSAQVTRAVASSYIGSGSFIWFFDSSSRAMGGLRHDLETSYTYTHPDAKNWPTLGNKATTLTVYPESFKISLRYSINSGSTIYFGSDSHLWYFRSDGRGNWADSGGIYTASYAPWSGSYRGASTGGDGYQVSAVWTPRGPKTSSIVYSADSSSYFYGCSWNQSTSGASALDWGDGTIYLGEPSSSVVKRMDMITEGTLGTSERSYVLFTNGNLYSLPSPLTGVTTPGATHHTASLLFPAGAVADYVLTRDWFGPSDITQSMHVITKEGSVYTSVSTAVVSEGDITGSLQHGDVIDVRKYVGLGNEVLYVTNNRNSKNPGIHIISGNTNTTNPVTSFIVNPDTGAVENVMDLGAIGSLLTTGANPYYTGSVFVTDAYPYNTGNWGIGVKFYRAYKQSPSLPRVARWYTFDINFDNE